MNESKQDKAAHLANLISVRNHLYMLLNSMSRNILDKATYPKISKLVSELDREVIKESLTSLSSNTDSVAKVAEDEALALKAKIEEAKKALANGSSRNIKKIKSDTVVMHQSDNGDVKPVIE